MFFQTLLSAGVVVAAALALPQGISVQGGSGSASPAPSSPAPFEVGAASAPPQVFYLNAQVPQIKGSDGLIAPFNGDFYIDMFYAQYCGGPTCTNKQIKSKPTFALYTNNQGNFLFLNTSVLDPGQKTGKSQLVYIHYTGQLRFFEPPQTFTANNEPASGFEIVKGANGTKDHLSFTGNPGYSEPAAPFMLCTEHGGPVDGKPFPIYQIYVATKGFKSFVQTSNCVEIVPEITYSTDGTYEWL